MTQKGQATIQNIQAWTRCFEGEEQRSKGLLKKFELGIIRKGVGGEKETSREAEKKMEEAETVPAMASESTIIQPYGPNEEEWNHIVTGVAKYMRLTMVRLTLPLPCQSR
jgi:hypothetical protein